MERIFTRWLPFLSLLFTFAFGGVPASEVVSPPIQAESKASIEGDGSSSKASIEGDG